jgi:hypothetical protein
MKKGDKGNKVKNLYYHHEKRRQRKQSQKPTKEIKQNHVRRARR